MLVTDRLRVFLLAKGRVEPSARVKTERFAGQRQSPLAELALEKCPVQGGQVTNLANAELVQILFGYLADARDFSHIERREKTRLLARQHPEHTIRLGLV